MDDDHLRIEALLAQAPQSADSDLPALLERIATELAAHFDSEADFLRGRDFPGLFCHVAQHAMLLDDLARAARTSGAALRRQIEVVVPQLIASHIATMDGMAARFIRGELTPADFEILRLPTPETAA